MKKNVNYHLKKAQCEFLNDKLTKALEKPNTKPFWNLVKSLKRDYIGVAPIRTEGKLQTLLTKQML